MTNKSTTPENAISRRHFLLSTCLATTALGLKPRTGLGAPARENPARGDAPGKLCLWYDRPAQTWMTEALPIGNGPMGAMLFGGTGIERVQFNEISLWSGTRMAVEGLDDEGQDLGAYQAFGDILIHLGHDFAKVTDYRQELDIDRAVHQVTYDYNGVRFQRTAFASHPDGVIVIHLTANKPSALHHADHGRDGRLHGDDSPVDGPPGLATAPVDFDPGTVLALAAIAFAAAFVYGVTGFGAGLVAIPLASLFFDMRFVLAVFALLDCVNAARVSLSRPKAIVRDEAARLVPTCIAGVALGSVLILALPAWVLMLALGIFVTAYLLYTVAARGALPTIGTRWAYAAGLSGGIASAMFGAGGPPYAIYLSMRPHGKEEMRATLAVTSLVSITTRIVAFGLAGLLDSGEVWRTALAIVPASLLSLWLADRVHKVLSREAVIAAIWILLGVAGISLIVRALTAA